MEASPQPIPLVGRFAPSPTGRMHAGNICAYLVAWIVAKRAGGTIVLRIEDLDPIRSKTSYAEQLQSDFELLGLTWDKGPIYQSQRQELYEEVWQTLQDKAELYPCFCTRADIFAASAPHGNEPLRYSGTCKNLKKADRIARLHELRTQGKAPSYRITTPSEPIEFRDIFQGTCHYNINEDCGDFVVRRNDRGFSYQFAVCVDDADMHINSVIRGFDLLSSTPQQLYLQQILGYKQPQYGHIPLLCTTEGRRIAKREHDASLDELIARFKNPHAVLGHIAYLLKLIEEDEPCSASELLSIANLNALNKVEKVIWH